MNFSEIKAQNDILEVARDLLNLDLTRENNDEWRGFSIFEPGNNKTCLRLNTAKQCFIDYKGGKEYSGSVLDLVAFVKFGNNNQSAIIEAAKLLSHGDFNSEYWQNWIKQRDYFRANVKKWHEALDEKVIDYLHSRRISDATIEENQLGLVYEWISIDGKPIQEWRLAVPYFNANHESVYMVSRALSWTQNLQANGKPVKYHKIKQNDFLQNQPFGLDTIPIKDSDCDLLTIGEGFFDALSLKQEGYKILFSGGGYFGKENEKKVIEQAHRFRRVVLVFDSDNSGSEFTAHIGNLLFQENIRFECVRSYGEGNKDISDFYTSGGNLEELIANTTDGLEYLAMNFKPNEKDSKARKKELEEKLKKFLIQAKHNGLDDADFQSLYENLIRAGYSPEWLKTVKKQSEKGERESEIVDAIVAEHKLLYNCRTGFYEYDDTAGIWRHKDDKVISGYVKKRLGKSSSATKLYNIVEHLKTAVYGDEPVELFNKRPLFAFKNGTLHIKISNNEISFSFRKADISDYVTHRVEYEYDEKAECSEWLNALNVIMDGDEKRIKCFQEFCGYCLLTHCIYEKALILRDKDANGSNGKSTLLKVLREVLGAENTSSLEPAEFVDKFSLIYLKDAKVNICNDARADISGAETNLKKAISGETLRGCYKNKDFIEFINNAKIIFAINGSLKAKNIDGALLRRCLLIDFNKRFVDEPIADNEVKKDINIADKLMAERAGIFNWIVQGASRLIKQGRFTETDEQAELIGAFTTVTEADTVNEFVAENSQNFSMQRIILADMFLKYVTFCTENEIKPLDNHKFYKVFEARLTTQNISYQRKQKRFLIDGELKNKEFYEFY